MTRPDFGFYSREGHCYTDAEVIQRFSEKARWGHYDDAVKEINLVVLVHRVLDRLSTGGKMNACAPVFRKVPYLSAGVLASAITERDRETYGVPENGVFPLVSNCLSAMGKAHDLDALQAVQNKLDMVMARLAMEKLRGEL